MKNIVFVFCEGCYPVPAIKGGAVESLAQMLLDQNEIDYKYNFYVVMCKNKRDKVFYDYSDYKHTKFYNYYQSDFRFKVDKYVNAFNKRLNYNLPLKSAYENYIIKIISQIKPDAIIFEGAFNASVRVLTKQYGKEKMFIHIHHQVLVKKKIDKYFGNMLCVSNFIKRDWIESQKLGRMFKYQVLPVAVTEFEIDEHRIRQIKQQYNFQDNNFIVVYCGRLIEIKGVDKLISAVNKIKNNNIKLLIIGGSEFKESKQTPFVKKIKKITLGHKNIIFTGYVDHNQLFNYYSVADLLVIPSICQESANLVSLEGRKLGIREVVTRSGGMPEYCSKKAKIIEIDNRLEENLVEAILDAYKEGHKEKTPEPVDGPRKYFDNFYKIFKD